MSKFIDLRGIRLDHRIIRDENLSLPLNKCSKKFELLIDSIKNKYNYLFLDEVFKS